MKRLRKMTISGESRPVYWFQEVGPNLQTYGNDLKNEYIVGPYERNDVIQQITGPFMVAASALLEGTDQIVAGVVDTRLESPKGILGREFRDGRKLVENVITLHPIRALTDGVRMATANLVLDGGDMLFGFRNKSYAQVA